MVNGRLLIKVGSGSMMVEELVANYEDIELAKVSWWGMRFRPRSRSRGLGEDPKAHVREKSSEPAEETKVRSHSSPSNGRHGGLPAGWRRELW